MAGWIGVDLDGTLAKYDGWEDILTIGEPIYVMLDRVKGWVAAGKAVRIVTARAAHGEEAVRVVQAWCRRHGLPALPVTDRKDFEMLELWDDRAVGVQTNTGLLRLGPPEEPDGTVG